MNLFCFSTLKRVSTLFLATITNNLAKLPYGILYIAKVREGGDINFFSNMIKKYPAFFLPLSIPQNRSKPHNQIVFIKSSTSKEKKTYILEKVILGNHYFQKSRFCIAV